jgi:hypothetical protein
MRLLTREAAVGSGLLAISRRRARDYAEVMAVCGYFVRGRQVPAGWNPRGEHGAPAGWDLVLVAPRTLSVLTYDLTGRALADLKRGRSGVAHATALLDEHRRMATAHHDAVGIVTSQFLEAAHIPLPWQTCHPLDSAGRPLLHTHVVFGALTEGGRRLPLDPGRLRALAARAIGSYHRRLRHQVRGVVAAYGPWGPAGPDGSAELLGLPAGLLAAHSGPCRPLGEIAACARAVGDLEP